MPKFNKAFLTYLIFFRMCRFEAYRLYENFSENRVLSILKKCRCSVYVMIKTREYSPIKFLESYIRKTLILLNRVFSQIFYSTDKYSISFPNCL